MLSLTSPRSSEHVKSQTKSGSDFVKFCAEDKGADRQLAGSDVPLRAGADTAVMAGRPE